MKVSLHSQREYERKIRQVEQRLEESKIKKRAYAQENKYLRARLKVLHESRAGWKAKNADKGQRIKVLAKGGIGGDKVRRHHFPLLLIWLCIKLRVEAGCSYRGICKILLIFQSSLRLDLKHLPCANTMENWVSKMGYYCLEHEDSPERGREVCLILDETIKQGNERVLLLLITPWQKISQEPLCRDEVQVCYLGGKSSWTSEKIKQEVDKIVSDKGLVIRGIVSDEDTKLLKASRLLGQPHLPDISHAIASCLRKTFEKDSTYQLLIKQITNYQAKSVNQDLTYLRPPKQRVKARFMNQAGFVNWGLTMLKKFKELNQVEQAFFDQLPAYGPILQVLGQSIGLGQQVARLLKAKGLSIQTIEEVQRYGGRFPKVAYWPKPKLDGRLTYDPIPALLDRFWGYLKVYIEKYKAFLKTHQGTFNVCSDIIESMFGTHKIICGSNTLVGISQLDLELPLHCLKPQHLGAKLKPALEHTFMTDLVAWRNDHSSDNQANRRRKFFGN